MKIGIYENGIYLQIEVTDNRDVRLLHLLSGESMATAVQLLFQLKGHRFLFKSLLYFFITSLLIK